MPSATFDKPVYSSGDQATVTVDYSDVTDGTLAFTGTLTPGGGGTPIPLSITAPVGARLDAAVVKLDGTAKQVTRADDQTRNRVTFTFTV